MSSTSASTYNTRSNEQLRKENEKLKYEAKELREAWEREMKESQRLRDIINEEEDDEEESSSDEESSDEEEVKTMDKNDQLIEMLQMVRKERDFEHIRFLEEQQKRSDLEQVIHETQTSGNAYKLEVLTEGYKQLKSQFNNIIELIKTADTDEKIKLLKELDFLN
jgi:hypothetical protein